MTNQNSINQNKSLPLDGLSRWEQIAHLVPFSRETFRKLVKSGKAPAGVRMSERCTVYPNRELHKFFADPLNYRADLRQQTEGGRG